MYNNWYLAIKTAFYQPKTDLTQCSYFCNFKCSNSIVMLKDCRLALRAQLISFIISIQSLLDSYTTPLST